MDLDAQPARAAGADDARLVVDPLRDEPGRRLLDRGDHGERVLGVGDREAHRRTFFGGVERQPREQRSHEHELVIEVPSHVPATTIARDHHVARARARREHRRARRDANERLELEHALRRQPQPRDDHRRIGEPIAHELGRHHDRHPRIERGQAIEQRGVALGRKRVAVLDERVPHPARVLTDIDQPAPRVLRLDHDQRLVRRERLEQRREQSRRNSRAADRGLDPDLVAGGHRREPERQPLDDDWLVVLVEHARMADERRERAHGIRRSTAREERGHVFGDPRVSICERICMIRAAAAATLVRVPALSLPFLSRRLTIGVSVSARIAISICHHSSISAGGLGSIASSASARCHGGRSSSSATCSASASRAGSATSSSAASINASACVHVRPRQAHATTRGRRQRDPHDQRRLHERHRIARELHRLVPLQRGRLGIEHERAAGVRARHRVRADRSTERDEPLPQLRQSRIDGRRTLGTCSAASPRAHVGGRLLEPTAHRRGHAALERQALEMAPCAFGRADLAQRQPAHQIRRPYAIHRGAPRDPRAACRPRRRARA